MRMVLESRQVTRFTSETIYYSISETALEHRADNGQMMQDESMQHPA
jgi:hypothetical protein